ncbi:MAG: hypothetical protein JOZ19_14895 [Rubrobacter sp.]|nr:hypothetical protein [Rubrobacter sp.]
MHPGLLRRKDHVIAALTERIPELELPESLPQSLENRPRRPPRAPKVFIENP